MAIERHLRGMRTKGYTARWGQINYKKKVHPKFLQNLLFHIPIDMFYGKKKFSAIESATVNFF